MTLPPLSLSPTRNCSRSRESQGSDGGSSVVAKTLKRTGNTVLNSANPAKRFLAEKKASTLTFGSDDAFDLPALKNHSGPVCIGHYSPLQLPVPAVTDRVRHGFANLSAVNWPDSEIYDIDMKGVLFAKAILINLVLGNVDFSGSYFGGANLAGATLKSTDLSRCNLSSADLTNLDLDQVDFSGANLSNVQMSLNQNSIRRTLQEAGTGVSLRNLLESIHSIDPAYRETKNFLMRSVIEQVELMDDEALQRHLPTLVKMLLNNRGYDEVPEIASFNIRLLPLWLQRKEHERYFHGEIDRDLVQRLVDRHPSKMDLVKRYGKTLGFRPDKTSSGAQTASPSTPAITGGTARS